MLSDEKVMHALGYIAWKCKNDPELTKLRALKVIYLADRWHLRKYGQTITEDEYYAMEFGPVPIRAWELIKNQFKNVPGNDEYLTIETLSGNERGALVAKKRPNLDWLSQTDIEALDAAINTYKKYGPKKIVDFAHSFPEWKKKATLLKNRRRVKMDIDDFFLPCAEADKEYCDADQEHVLASKEYFHDCEW